jgi:hypothetical protein
MGKRSRVLLAILLISVLGGAAWYFFPSREPTYNGKPFSFWLEEYTHGPSSDDYLKAREALGKMGTDAVPIIIHTLERNDSLMINRYREGWAKLPNWSKTILPRPKPQRFMVFDAARAFDFLSPTNVAPHLSSLVRSPNPAVREAAFMYIFHGPSHLPKDDLLSLCQHGLKDTDSYARQYSAHALANVGLAASNAVPELLVSLQGRINGRGKDWISFSCYSTAKALGNIGPPAAIAFPALLNQLNNHSNDTVTLIAVTNALKTIDPEAAAKAGVK